MAALRAELATVTTKPRTDAASGSRDSSVHVYRAHDLTGLPIVVVLDAGDPDRLRWSALTVLDDADAVLDTEAHKQRWRAWLYWTNLTQFLSLAGGDGVQLAASRAAEFDVEVLAVCGGVGELESLSGVPSPTAAWTAAEQPLAAASTAQTRRRDPGWDDEILPLLREEPDQTGDLLRLGEMLADRGKRAPVFGYELGTSRWLADFGWDDVKIAVIHDQGLSDDEAARRDDAYAEAGWTTRAATDWLDHLDELTAQLPDTEGRTR